MSKPTVASLAADLAAANKVISTYVAQLNTLHNTVADLKARLDETQQAVTETAQQVVRRTSPRVITPVDRETYKAACAKFFELNPHARSVTNTELRNMGFIQ